VHNQRWPILCDRLTMLVIDINGSGSYSLIDDALDRLVIVELLSQALSLDFHGFNVFSARVWVFTEGLVRLHNCTRRELTGSANRQRLTLLDVVFEALEAFEAFEEFIRLPSVVQMTVSLPLDEEL
jgi:hypothetical protein